MSSTLTADQHTDTAPCHEHPEPAWPLRPADWDALAACHDCGIGMLRVFIRSATWVVRRVEKVEFLDDRTVRRHVSMDYALPDDAVALRRADGTLTRIVPLTMMRRKSLVNFDLRDEHGRALPLLGLREAQALTLAIARAWARWSRTTSPRTCSPAISTTPSRRWFAATSVRWTGRSGICGSTRATRTPCSTATSTSPG
jgi:hypothetical protein